MKVFLCWSGEKSRQTAERFKEWLPQLIQAVDPWMSPDIERGAHWGLEIADQLEKSKVGIICLTRENLDSRWVLFESGALSKTKDARPCTFLLDITPVEVKQPLAQFQHTRFKEGDVWKLLLTVNKKVDEAGEIAPSEKTLANLFKVLWPQFEKELHEIAKQQPTANRQKRKRDKSEILEEVLELVRAQGRQIEQLVHVHKMKKVPVDLYESKTPIFSLDMSKPTENTIKFTIEEEDEPEASIVFSIDENLKTIKLLGYRGFDHLPKKLRKEILSNIENSLRAMHPSYSIEFPLSLF